jgi:predicted short-subunit dehydrogenase-like oxidoreductase (DUF2520 family)
VAATRIAIVGTGVLARALGRSLCALGEPVVAIGSQTPSRAEQAARFLGPGVHAATWEGLAQGTTHVLIATSDDRIGRAACALAAAGMRDATALHTAGARGADALAPLRGAGVACGVLHPLHTIVDPAAAAQFSGVTFGVAGDPSAVEWASRIAGRLGGRVLLVREDRMAAYHAAAVLAGNALPALLDSAARLMEDAGISYDAALQALGPLAGASAVNTIKMGPATALTGPVVRGDVGTIEAHVAAMACAPADVAGLYLAVSRRLIDLARRRGLPEATLAALSAALERTPGDMHEPQPDQNR